MAGTINKVILIGHTGTEIKMHYFEGGGCVGNFTLATNEEYTNKAGDRIKNTEWHNIVMHNKAAEICEKYLGKGDKIYIEGRIRTRRYQDDKGLDRYFTEIHCDEFTFLTPKDQSSASGNPTENRPQKAEANQNKSRSTGAEEESDDLPF
jgi:single-strand DNA-binding protein